MKPSPPLEISVQDAKQLLDSDEEVMFIDCREPDEFEYCRIDGTQLVPLGNLPAWSQSIADDGRPLVVICHHGVRSLHAVHWLRKNGISNARSMAGGIDHWSLEIDPALPRY